MKAQIIEAIVVIISYLLLRLFINNYINRFIENKNSTNARRNLIVKKAINLTLIIILLIIIFSIFGVDQSELLMFIGSVVTVIGVALFAQWSVLSNITAGVIIFFNHSVKLDDVVSIIDKDYEVEGRVVDIGLFFISLTTNNNEHITIPNNVFLQKMVKNINQKATS